jgi:asparagine synthase (glutamine-hydrolysing)
MPGFHGVIGKIKDISRSIDTAIQLSSTTENQQYSFNNIWVKRSVVPKFLDDKVFDEDEEFFVCTDGIFLNSKKLCTIYSADTNFDLIKTLYRKKGSSFANELRGTFSGCLYHKKTDSFYLFTDHLGTKRIFYFFDTDTKRLIFGSELKSVANLMKLFHIKTRLSDVGAYCLLSFGFMLGSYTLIEEVKRLSPGSVLTYQKENIASKQYYYLNNTPYHKETKVSITTNLNDLFTEAIIAEYEKDKEYGYQHIGTLSGGLDSRMNLLSARKLDYNDLYTITVSQSNYLDEKIAKSIASHFGFNFIFYGLDNGNYLSDIERPMFANDGLVLYSGSAHLYRILSLLNWQPFGLLHTGMLGDAVLGTYLSCKKHLEAQPFVKSESHTLLSRIDSVATTISQEYENSELYLFYNRGINGIFNGYWTISQFTEFSSPFLHIDFLEYAIKIHPQLRFRHKIYHQWIVEHLPEATKFIWETAGMKINANLFWYRCYVRKALKRISRFIRGPLPSDSMTPMEYWFKTNERLIETLNNYFSSHIEALKYNTELYKDATLLFKIGTPIEKTQVLTLLAALQLLDLNAS